MKNRSLPVSATAPHVVHPVEGSEYGKRRDICTCFIIPQHVLERFAKDRKLSAEQRQYFVDAAKLEQDWRKTRASTAKLANLSRSLLPTGMSAIATAAPLPCWCSIAKMEARFPDARSPTPAHRPTVRPSERSKRPRPLSISTTGTSAEIRWTMPA